MSRSELPQKNIYHPADSVQAIHRSLIEAYERDKEKIQKYFELNPTAIKFKKAKDGVDGPTCSVIKADNGKLLLLANENLMSPGEKKIGKRSNLVAKKSKKYGDVAAGAFGNVKFALDFQNRELCAVKIEEGEAEKIIKEQKVASSVGITQQGFDSIITRTDGGESKEAMKHYTVLQYLGTPLSSLLTDGKVRSYDERLKIIRLIFQKIEKLHDTGYEHGDLHLANITVQCDSLGSVIDLHLIDFGSARELDNRGNDYTIVAPALLYLLTRDELQKLIPGWPEKLIISSLDDFLKPISIDWVQKLFDAVLPNEYPPDALLSDTAISAQFNRAVDSGQWDAVNNIAKTSSHRLEMLSAHHINTVMKKAIQGGSLETIKIFIEMTEKTPAVSHYFPSKFFTAFSLGELFKQAIDNQQPEIARYILDKLEPYQIESVLYNALHTENEDVVSFIRDSEKGKAILAEENAADLNRRIQSLFNSASAAAVAMHVVLPESETGTEQTSMKTSSLTDNTVPVNNISTQALTSAGNHTTKMEWPEIENYFAFNQDKFYKHCREHYPTKTAYEMDRDNAISNLNGMRQVDDIQNNWGNLNEVFTQIYNEFAIETTPQGGITTPSNAELGAGKFFVYLKNHPKPTDEHSPAQIHQEYRKALTIWYREQVEAGAEAAGAENDGAKIEKLHLLFSCAKKDKDLKYGIGKVDFSFGKSNSYQSVIGDIKTQIIKILKNIPLESKTIITFDYIGKMREILKEEVGRGPHFFNSLMGGTESYRDAKERLDKLEAIASTSLSPRTQT